MMFLMAMIRTCEKSIAIVNRYNVLLHLIYIQWALNIAVIYPQPIRTDKHLKVSADPNPIRLLKIL